MSRENNLSGPSIKHLLKILDQHPNGLSSAALSRLLHLDHRSVRTALKHLERKENVIKTASLYVTTHGQTQRFSGIFKRKFSGSGIVFTNKDAQEVQIGRKQGFYLFDGDHIEFVMFPDRRGFLSGSVLTIMKRRESPFPGYYRIDAGTVSVHPLDPRIGPPVRVTGRHNEKWNGQVVLVQLEQAARLKTLPTGKIIKVLGRRFDFGVQTEILIRKFNIPDEMPEAVNREARSLIDQAAAKNLGSRHDLRTMPTITVDPPHARDFDDALSLIERPDGVRLGVHIADVSHFVPVDSLVDREAFSRGTSVYLPERAIHMLPEALATEVCSLLPNEDRMAVSVIIDFDHEGRIIDGEVFESIIRSDARLTYAEFLATANRTDAGRSDLNPEIREMCIGLAHLCGKLILQRVQRGVLDLDMPEAYFELDENGKVCGIHKKSRSIAEQTIEEFMIAANVFVAQFLEKHKTPYLRRVHDAPDPSEINDLKQGLMQLGLTPPPNPLNPNEVRQLLAGIDNNAIRSVASHRILRAMKRAVYSATESGHFGLALEFYTQFTSPIRRYPDMEVHRSIKAALKIPGYTTSCVTDLALKAPVLSDHERRAQEAEWEAVRIEKIRFMQTRIGETFSGTITHVIEFGAYIELDEPFVEGFLPVSLMTEFYHFRANGSYLTNQSGTKQLRPGQTVRVMLESADLDRGNLDFRLI